MLFRASRIPGQMPNMKAGERHDIKTVIDRETSKDYKHPERERSAGHDRGESKACAGVGDRR